MTHDEPLGESTGCVHISHVESGNLRQVKLPLRVSDSLREVARVAACVKLVSC